MKRPKTRSAVRQAPGPWTAVAAVVVLGLALAAGVYFASTRGGRSQAAAPEAPTSPPPLLMLEEPVRHGRIVEVRGRTWPNASVTVNGRAVPAVFSDGSFYFFTAPLPLGPNTITVTAQTTAGETKTIRRTVVLE